MKNVILVVVIVAGLFLSGCANLAEFAQKDPLVATIVVKDSTIGAIALSSNDKEKRRILAGKVTKVADDMIKAIDTGGVKLTKAALVQRLNKELAQREMEIYMKALVSDLILVLDRIFPDPDVNLEIPADKKELIKKVFEDVKLGASFF